VSENWSVAAKSRMTSLLSIPEPRRVRELTRAPCCRRTRSSRFEGWDADFTAEARKALRRLSAVDAHLEPGHLEQTGNGPVPRTPRAESTSSWSPVVEAEETTESLAPLDRSIEPLRAVVWVDELVVEALVVPFGVVVSDELAQRAVQHVLAEEDQSVETLTLDAADETLGVGVHVRGANGGEQGRDTGCIQDVSELLGEPGVAVGTLRRAPRQPSA
jgi:hypothetical protein